MMLQILPLAPTTAAPYCTQPAEVLGLIFDIMGVTFAFMIMALSLFWMAAQLLKKPEYEGFVSIEINQLIVSAILLATVFGAMLFSCELAVAFSGDDQFTIASRYLSTISNDIALKAILSLEAAKVFCQYWSSMSFRWGLTVWGLAVPAFPSFILLERVTDFLLLVVTPFVASLTVQQILLEVIKSTTATFILPAGVVLRAFPPTRNAGSFLIATAMGFHIIYSYTYVMHKLIVEKMIENSNLPSALANMFNDSSLAEGLSPFALAEKGFFDMEVLFFHPLEALGFLLLQALFLPALSITLTVSFIKWMAKFLSQKM